MFVVTKASGGWRPIISLSTLNLSVVKTRFRMETAQSVLRSIRGGRLDGLRRYERCLSLDPHSSFESQVPQVHSWGKGLAVQGPLFRSVHGASSVHTGHGSCVQLPSSVRSSDASVSGRLDDSGVVSQGSLLGKGQSPEFLSRTRDCGQLGQVLSCAVSVDCVSRDQDRVADFPGFADSLEDRNVLLISRRISVLRGAVCEVLESPLRPPRVSDSSCSKELSSLESSSVSSQAQLGLLRRLGLHPLGRSSVVVSRGLSRGGGVVGRSLSRPHVLARRFGSGLGSHSCGPLCVGSLARGRGGALHQSSRASCCQERSSCLLRPSPGSDGRSLLRQHHSGVLSPSSGRDFLTGPQRSDSGHSSLGRHRRSLSSLSLFWVAPTSSQTLSHPNQVIGAEWTLHQEDFDMI